MVYIIHGERNQGKTTRIRSLYRDINRGDGFCSEKIFRDSIHYGYEITRLATGESMLLSLKSERFPENIIPFCICGSFSFFEKPFVFAASVINDAVKAGSDPVYIDEIGPLELQEKGFYQSFQTVLKSGKPVYCTVRNNYVDQVISFFELNDYSLIDLG